MGGLFKGQDLDVSLSNVSVTPAEIPSYYSPSIHVVIYITTTSALHFTRNILTNNCVLNLSSSALQNLQDCFCKFATTSLKSLINGASYYDYSLSWIIS